MKAINKISLTTVLGILTILACTSSIAAGAPDISGTYTCTGQDPYQVPPSPPAFSEKIVLKKNGDAYVLQTFSVDSSVPWDYGTAIFNKDINDSFTYVYWLVKDSTKYGSELMIIKPDGSLDGVFMDNGKNKIGTETCTKAS